MSRPFTDITTAISSNPIKNGSIVEGVTFRGSKSTLNTYVKNTPTISNIQSKYGNRFYNGTFVRILNPGIVQLSAAEYANLGTYDPNTIYVIV